jgi:hypothetical protein
MGVCFRLFVLDVTMTYNLKAMELTWTTSDSRAPKSRKGSALGSKINQAQLEL